jgi:hypothetical protein
MAPTRRVMTSWFRKMPTTSVRRLSSPLSRSSGLAEWIFGLRSPAFARQVLGKAHEGEDIGFGLIQRRQVADQLRPKVTKLAALMEASHVSVLLATEPYRRSAMTTAVDKWAIGYAVSRESSKSGEVGAFSQIPTHNSQQ